LEPPGAVARRGLGGRAGYEPRRGANRNTRRSPACTGSGSPSGRRLGAEEIELASPAGTIVARHRLAPAGAGALRRSEQHRVALEQVVLGTLTSSRPCRRKANRPPGQAALAAAPTLLGDEADVVVDLDRYARYAEAAR
jgi:hypothetical protein